MQILNSALNFDPKNREVVYREFPNKLIGTTLHNLIHSSMMHVSVQTYKFGHDILKKSVKAAGFSSSL